MSIINDALKKAQRDRTGTTGEPPSFASEGSGGRSSSRRSGGPDLTPVFIGAGAAVAVIALAGIGFFLFRGKPATPATTVATVTEPAKTVAAQTAPIQTVSSSPSAQPNSNTTTLPTVHTEPTPETAPAFKLNIAEKPAPTKPAAPAVAKKTEPAPVETVPATPGTPSAKMIDLIEALRVSGIRASGSDSKVLMNDRVYRLNDLVDRELGIRLIGVEPGALTFRDPSGAVYTRHF